MAGVCKRCGKCCEALWLPHSPDETRQMARAASTDSDAWSAARFFKPITFEEAVRINPELAEWDGGGYFYECMRFCKVSRTCTVHAIRPNTCSKFPWYNGVNLTLKFYTKDCGYVEDQEALRKKSKCSGRCKGVK